MIEVDLLQVDLSYVVTSERRELQCMRSHSQNSRMKLVNLLYQRDCYEILK